jgi:hypothetical protein
MPFKLKSLFRSFTRMMREKCKTCVSQEAVLPVEEPKTCAQCYFATSYCQWCMIKAVQETSCFICDSCALPTQNYCQKVECFHRPQLPLIHPAVCVQHFQANIQEILVGRLSVLSVCCRCGKAKNHFQTKNQNCFQTYTNPKWVNLQMCSSCAMIVTLHYIQKHIFIKPLATIICSFFI